MKAAVVSEQGIRPEMEDAHFLDLNFAKRGWVFGGIYDGHNGAFAASHASQKLHLVFLESVLTGTALTQAFSEAYERISEELSTQESGATAVTFFIRDEVIFAANAGDARAIVVSANDIRQLTTDHRVDNTEERERIEKAGGIIRYPYVYRYVYRGLTGIMPTRSIGDAHFKSVGVIATPAISEYRITRDNLMLIAACDGLFDFMTNEEVAGFARRLHDPQTLVEALKKEVLITRSGTDNLTIIAVSLREDT